MLDAYIIDRIRREQERERREGGFVPLHIEPTRPPEHHRKDDDRNEETPERGSVVIDFHM